VAYTSVIPNRVRKQIRGLTPYAFERIKEAMLGLADDPRPLDRCLKLKGTKGEYRG
jgi:hypothetical protein